MWGKRDTNPLLVGMQTGQATMEISLEIPQKPFDPAIPLLGIYPKEFKLINKKAVCTLMFIAAQFTIAKTWNQPKCPSMVDWIKKLWDMYSLEYYTAVRNNEIQSFATKWRNLEHIMLSEVSQSQRDKYHMFSLIGDN